MTHLLHGQQHRRGTDLPPTAWALQTLGKDFPYPHKETREANTTNHTSPTDTRTSTPPPLSESLRLDRIRKPRHRPWRVRSIRGSVGRCRERRGFRPRGRRGRRGWELVGGNGKCVFVLTVLWDRCCCCCLIRLWRGRT